MAPELDPDNDRWFLGTFMHFHVTAADTDGRCTIVEQLAPSGFSPPLHVHDDEDAVIYVLEGRITARVGDEERVVDAGGAVVLPRQRPHTFRVESATARILEITTPGGAESFYRAAGEPAKERALPSPAAPDVERLAREAAKIGATIVGPPMHAE